MNGIVWEDLENSVDQQLADGKLGNPVFLRWLIDVGSDASQLESSMSKAVQLANSWFKDEPNHTEKQGDDTTGQITSAITWPMGQSAIVSIASTKTGRSTKQDLVLLCHKGSIYHRTPAFS